MQKWFFFALVAMLMIRGTVASQAALPAPTHANVKYGPAARNVLDVWTVKTTTPAPAVIYFHSGGFVQGDKSEFVQLNAMMFSAGAQTPDIAFVSANYRFVMGKESTPFPGPLLDGARVVQFIRAHAQEYNIDPKRIVVAGSSGGAMMALWIAFHDDLADPKAEDPIARKSTRVSGVLSMAGQTTIDPHAMKDLGGPKEFPNILAYFGVKKSAELETPAVRAVITEASPISHVSADDPPVYMVYPFPMTPTPLPETTNWMMAIHHPFFGTLLQKELDRVKVPYQFYTGDKPAPFGTEMAFLNQILGVKTAPTTP